ncbi:MAG: hypothetical protein ABJA82_01080 [Myxococcales bacterium]
MDPDWWQAIRVDPDNRNDERWGTGFERGQIEIPRLHQVPYPGRRGELSQFEWRARHFDSLDRVNDIRQDGSSFKEPDGRYIYRFLHNEAGYQPPDESFGTWVSLEKGDYEFLTGADIDFGRADVRRELRDWGAWIAKTIGADGVRLDAVKHSPIRRRTAAGTEIPVS